MPNKKQEAYFTEENDKVVLPAAETVDGFIFSRVGALVLFGKALEIRRAETAPT